MRILIVFFCILCVFAQTARKASHEALPKLRGDEKIEQTTSVPYLGGRQSPGDQIGITWYDIQASGSYGQRIVLDDLGQAHVDWMWRMLLMRIGIVHGMQGFQMEHGMARHKHLLPGAAM